MSLAAIYITLLSRYNSRRPIKMNEMNRVLCHFCAHVGLTRPGESPEDREMDEMTLPSRHRIRNSSPGGLTLSTLPLGHGGSLKH